MTTTHLQAQTSQLAQRGIDAVQDAALQLRDKAQMTTDTTVHYIQREPIKSVLIAAAVGASLMALATAIGSARSR